VERRCFIPSDVVRSGVAERPDTVQLQRRPGVEEDSVEKFRFMSPAWIAMAREQITQVLAGTALGGINFTLCEEFTNPPDDL
jgi:hypothetical protein